VIVPLTSFSFPRPFLLLTQRPLTKELTLSLNASGTGVHSDWLNGSLCLLCLSHTFFVDLVGKPEDLALLFVKFVRAAISFFVFFPLTIKNVAKNTRNFFVLLLGAATSGGKGAPWGPPWQRTRPITRSGILYQQQRPPLTNKQKWQAVGKASEYTLNRQLPLQEQQNNNEAMQHRHHYHSIRKRSIQLD
jgi:hypothetical protein